LAQQTTTILQWEHGKFEEIQHQLEMEKAKAKVLNIVLNNCPSYFSSTYNNIKSQREIIANLRK